MEPDRRNRFAREARVLATLNHPHIAAIYGLEEAGGLTALVLELVEGPTLAERLARGPLPVSQALVIAGQVADALEAAHQKNIVHRDLKPSNIVLQGASAGSAPLSSDLRARVLDFGLAKMAGGEPDTDAIQRPRDTVEGKTDGRLLGSPAYMSPEQARGEAVDKRADIWAFGCVLPPCRVTADGAAWHQGAAGHLAHRSGAGRHELAADRRSGMGVRSRLVPR